VVPAVGGTGTLTSSSPDCLGQALGAGQSEVGAVGGRRGEQITQHSGKCSLRAIPKQQCTCPIPYTTDMMSLNPLQPYGVYNLPTAFRNPIQASRAQENYHKPWPGVVNHLVRRSI